MFAKTYYNSLQWEGRLEIQFSVESTTPRRLIHDTRNALPMFRNFQNTMDIPVSVKREFDTTIDLIGIEKLVVEMLLEFVWFFHYDLDEAKFQGYINYLKKDGLYIPEVLITPGGTEV